MLISLQSLFIVFLSLCLFNKGSASAKCQIELSSKAKETLLDRLNQSSSAEVLKDAEISGPMNADNFDELYQPGGPLSYPKLLKLRKSINKKLTDSSTSLEDIKALEALRRSTWPLFEALESEPPECLRIFVIKKDDPVTPTADSNEIRLAKTKSSEGGLHTATAPQASKTAPGSNSCLSQKPFSFKVANQKKETLSIAQIVEQTKALRKNVLDSNQKRRTVLLRNAGSDFKTDTVDWGNPQSYFQNHKAQADQARKQQKMFESKICKKDQEKKCLAILEKLATQDDPMSYMEQTFDEDRNARFAMVGKEKSAAREHFRNYRMWHSRLLLLQMALFNEKTKYHETQLANAKDFGSQINSIDGVYDSITGDSNWIYKEPNLQSEAIAVKSLYLSLKKSMDAELAICQKPSNNEDAVAEGPDQKPDSGDSATN